VLAPQGESPRQFCHKSTTSGKFGSPDTYDYRLEIAVAFASRKFSANANQGQQLRSAATIRNDQERDQNRQDRIPNAKKRPQPTVTGDTSPFLL